MFLDYAENQAIEKRVMYMKDWAIKLDKFLEFNEYDILKDKGKVSRNDADKMAQKEFKVFRAIQDENYISDFDRFLKDSIANKKTHNPDKKRKKKMAGIIKGKKPFDAVELVNSSRRGE
jgi:hypothetical protein